MEEGLLDNFKPFTLDIIHGPSNQSSFIDNFNDALK